MRAQAKTSEIAILVIVSLMSFVANLPNHLLGPWIDKRLLLIALSTSVLIAMLRHLRALLSMSIAILAIGANLPESLAASLGISPVVMMVSLALVVVLTLLNKAFKLLPSGVADGPTSTSNQQPLDIKLDTRETRLAVLMAISKGDCFILNRLLDMNVEINFSLDGLVPILIAAEKGYADITRALLQHGVDSRVRNKEGKTPFEVALERKDFSTAEVLYNATRTDLSKCERLAFVDHFFARQKNPEEPVTT
ncbi:MAG: ankyrin repeat domain-containing protein [Gallionellaceae bacterium]